MYSLFFLSMCHDVFLIYKMFVRCVFLSTSTSFICQSDYISLTFRMLVRFLSSPSTYDRLFDIQQMPHKNHYRCQKALSLFVCKCPPRCPNTQQCPSLIYGLLTLVNNIILKPPPGQGSPCSSLAPPSCDPYGSK